MVLRLAIYLVEVHGTLHTWICRLQFREAIYALVVANKNHRIKRILKVVGHKLLLDIGTAFVDKVEGNLE